MTNGSGLRELELNAWDLGQPLLDAGSKKATCSTRAATPGSTVDQRPLDPNLWQLSTRVKILNREAPGLVNLHIDAQAGRNRRTPRHHYLNAIGLPTPKSLFRRGGASSKTGTVPSVQHSCPQLLNVNQWSVVQDNEDLPTGLPPTCDEHVVNNVPGYAHLGQLVPTQN
jgi:hypothetical protein